MNNFEDTQNIKYYEVDGKIIAQHKGLYFICDGGYNTWVCLMCPFKDQPPGTDIEKWCKP